MRKLRVFESISVDGCFTDANGDMSWAHAGREDAEFAEWGQRECEFGRGAAFRAQDVPDDGGFLADANGSAADAGCREGHERRDKIRRIEDDPTEVGEHAPLERRAVERGAGPQRERRAGHYTARQRQRGCAARQGEPR
jgi:hypothetical protein